MWTTATAKADPFATIPGCLASDHVAHLVGVSAEKSVGDQLLERVAAGDEGAVQSCIEEFGPLVWSLALKASPNRMEAEDVVQEVFIDLWKSASRFDPSRSSAKGFVAMITRRRLIDRFRKAERRPQLVDFPEGFQVASREHERIEASITSERVLEALKTLPESQKEALRLSLIQGLSHGEISEMTGTPLGTVKSNIRRGMLKIRSMVLPTESEAV